MSNSGGKTVQQTINRTFDKLPKTQTTKILKINTLDDTRIAKYCFRFTFKFEKLHFFFFFTLAHKTKLCNIEFFIRSHTNTYAKSTSFICERARSKNTMRNGFCDDDVKFYLFTQKGSEKRRDSGHSCCCLHLRCEHCTKLIYEKDAVLKIYSWLGKQCTKQQQQIHFAHCENLITLSLVCVERR